MPASILSSSLRPGQGNLPAYNLPKGLLKLSLWQNPNFQNPEVPIFELRQELKIIPDPDHRYYLRYTNPGNYSDTLSVNVSAEGYLTSIDATSEDATPEIVQNLLDMIKQAAIPSLPPSGSRSADGALTMPVEIFQATFDPFDAEELTEVNNAIRALVGEFSLNVKVLGKNGTEKHQPGSDIEGIACRPMCTAELRFNMRGAQRSQLIENFPHPHVVQVIALPRAPFVKSTVKLAFTPLGYPISVQLDHPSWVAAATRLPGRILSGIISLPAQLVQLKLNYSSERLQQKEESARLHNRHDELLEAIKLGKAPAQGQPLGLPPTGGGDFGAAPGAGNPILFPPTPPSFDPTPQATAPASLPSNTNLPPLARPNEPDLSAPAFDPLAQPIDPLDLPPIGGGN